MKANLYFLLIPLTIGCASQKHVESSKVKVNTLTEIDSSYVDNKDEQTTTVRTSKIEYDSDGKTKQAQIFEVIKQAKNESKSGKLNKAIDETKVKKETIKDKQQINLTPLILGGAVIAFFVLLIVILMVYLVHKFKK